MSFAPVYPVWYWLYFAVGGSIAALCFVGVMWYKAKSIALAKGAMRGAAKWKAFGYTFLFMAAWATWGIAGPPGYVLAPDKANYSIAFGATILAMLFSVLGWICLFVGQRKLYKTTASSDVSETGNGGHIA